MNASGQPALQQVAELASRYELPFVEPEWIGDVIDLQPNAERPLAHEELLTIRPRASGETRTTSRGRELALM